MPNNAYDVFDDAIDKVRKEITYVKWKNNDTRLNQTNMNFMSDAIGILRDILHPVDVSEGGNGKLGLLDETKNIKTLVQGYSDVDYTIQDYYTQIKNLNKAVFGNVSKAESSTAPDIDYQVSNDDGYFNTGSLVSYDTLSKNPTGILQKFVDYYDNDYKPLRNYLSELSACINIGDKWTGDLNAREPFHKESSNFKGMQFTEGGNVYQIGIFEGSDNLQINASNIVFNNALGIDIHGNINPLITESSSIGNKEPFQSVYITQVHSNSLVATGNGSSIGDSSQYWGSGYVSTIHSSELLPANSGVSTLGANESRWGAAYIVTGQIYSLNSEQLKATNADVDSQGENETSVVIKSTLDAEQQRAEAAEKELTDALTTESLARTSEDEAINLALNNEVTNRTNADTQLQTDIDAINLALSYLADKDVITAEPSFAFSSSNVAAVEVGTNIEPNYSIAFDAGKYEYGPNPTGSNASGCVVTFNGESLASNTGSFKSVHVEDETSIVLSAECTYSDGSIPKNNLGLDYPEGKIIGATKTITRTLKGYRQAFAGGSESKDTPITEIYSKAIRALNPKGNNKKTFDITISASDIRVIIAFPSGWGILKTVLDVNDSNKNIVSAFGEYRNTDVSGATEGQDVMEYKLYTMDFASAYGGSGNTYKVTIG